MTQVADMYEKPEPSWSKFDFTVVSICNGCGTSSLNEICTSSTYDFSPQLMLRLEAKLCERESRDSGSGSECGEYEPVCNMWRIPPELSKSSDKGVHRDITVFELWCCSSLKQSWDEHFRGSKLINGSLHTPGLPVVHIADSTKRDGGVCIIA